MPRLVPPRLLPALLLLALPATLPAASPDPDPAAGPRQAPVRTLDESNFERLTQAATGATTGAWLVAFCEGDGPDCRRLRRLLARVGGTLLQDAEDRGTAAATVAVVDVESSPWLGKRFGLHALPAVLFFRKGAMHPYVGEALTHDRLVRFAQRGYASSGKVSVPPEPHVADSHERTFMLACGGVAAVSVVLYAVDLVLQRGRGGRAKRGKKAS